MLMAPSVVPFYRSSDDGNFSLSDTFGALLVGTFIGMALYGIILHQSYRYFRLYPNDCMWTKCMVSTILGLETFHMVMSTHLCYYYLVTNFFNPAGLSYGVWSIKLLTGTSGVIIATSQSFFARRLYLFGNKYKIVVWPVVILLLGELAFFCAGTIQTFLFPMIADFKRFTWLVSVGAVMAQTADTMLTSVLIITLRNSRTGMERMDNVIDTLILYAVNTGLLTSLVNLMSFLFSVIFPGNMIWGAFGIICTKLYANSFLAALNARKSLHSRVTYDINVDWVNVPLTPPSDKKRTNHTSSSAGSSISEPDQSLTVSVGSPV